MSKQCIICGNNKFEIKSERFCSQKCIHIYGSRNAGINKIECDICNRKISKNNFQKHLKTHEKKEINYFCENCGCECFESYGSNRFCSIKCARSYSTKNKREEINSKVSERLKGYIYPGRVLKELIESECPICHELFKKHTKTCSKTCGAKLAGIKNFGQRYKIKDTSRMGGPRPGGGRSIPLPYTNWLGDDMKLNKEEIEVAIVLDRLKLNWKRNNTIGFLYTTVEGKKRKFYPDFVVNENEFIEYKGWVTSAMEHKMKDAVETNDLNLTIIVGTDKRYKDYGLSLKEFKNMKELQEYYDMYLSIPTVNDNNGKTEGTICELGWFKSSNLSSGHQHIHLNFTEFKNIFSIKELLEFIGI